MHKEITTCGAQLSLRHLKFTWVPGIIGIEKYDPITSRFENPVIARRGRGSTAFLIDVADSRISYP